MLIYLLLSCSTGQIDSLPPELAQEEGEGGRHYTLPHPIWSRKELESIQITHTPPKDKVDKVCMSVCTTMHCICMSVCTTMHCICMSVCTTMHCICMSVCTTMHCICMSVCTTMHCRCMSVCTTMHCICMSVCTTMHKIACTAMHKTRNMLVT